MDLLILIPHVYEFISSADELSVRHSQIIGMKIFLFAIMCGNKQFFSICGGHFGFFTYSGISEFILFHFELTA